MIESTQGASQNWLRDHPALHVHIRRYLILERAEGSPCLLDRHRISDARDLRRGGVFWCGAIAKVQPGCGLPKHLCFCS